MLQVHTPDEVRHAALRDPEIPAYIHRAMAGYALHYYYFEVFEMMRKLALVGVAVVFEPGSMEQASYGLLVCFFCVVVYSSCSPYVDRRGPVGSLGAVTSRLHQCKADAHNIWFETARFIFNNSKSFEVENELDAMNE